MQTMGRKSESIAGSPERKRQILLTLYPHEVGGHPEKEVAGNRFNEPGPKTESFEILLGDQFIPCQLPNPEFMALRFDVMSFAVAGETMEDENAADLLSFEGFQGACWLSRK